MLFRKNTTPEQDFWKWFCKSRFLKTEGAPLVEALGQRVNAISEHIVFEVGPTDQRPRELIISADGIRAAAEHVERLADAAPPMPDWKITRFRPRLPDYANFSLEFGTVTATAETMKFVAKRRDALVNLYLFTNWCNEPDAGPDGPAFIMLDMALGEYDVMCRVGAISMHPLDHAPEHAQPWSELQSTFDRLSE